MTGVEQIMSRPVYTCTPEDPQATAVRLMWEQDCGAIAVVGVRGELVGMVTDRDICMSAYHKGEAPGNIPVSAAMSKQVVSCKATDSIATAEKLMRERQIRRLPVVDEGNHPVGFISMNDLALHVATRGDGKVERDFLQTMAAICEHRHAA